MCGETAECAAHLYNRASAVMSEAEQLSRKGLHVSATASYQRASHMLKCADAKLTEAQLNDFEDWKVANVLGLGNRIKDAIQECNRLSAHSRWRK